MARFAVDNDHDSSASLWIAILLAFIYTWLVFLARSWSKSHFLGSEDAVLFAAQLVASGQFGASASAIEQGIASSSSRGHAVSSSFKASQILYIIAIALTKVSVVFLIRRIFSNLEGRKVWALCIGVGSLSTLWGVGSVLAIAIDCDYAHLQQAGNDGGCAGSSPRWLIVTIFDCLTEAAIVGLSAFFCSRLQMKTNRKAKVVVIFGVRFLCIVFSAVQFANYTQAGDHVSDHTFLTHAMILQQVSLGYALISATIPVSLHFIGGFNTGISAAIGSSGRSTNSSSYRYAQLSTRKRSKPSISRALEECRPLKQPSISGPSTEANALRVGVPAVGNSTNVWHTPRSPILEHVIDSQERAILREDVITISHT